MKANNPKSHRNWILLFYLFLLLANMTSEASAAHKCSYCHKKIDSDGLEVDGKYFHPNHFVCSNCLRPIGESRFFVHDDKYYDSVCLVNYVAERCFHCGQPILDESIYFETNFYHAACYNNFVGKRCVVCGDIAQGEFLVDNRGNAVCKKHQDAAAHCHACQQFLPPVNDGSWHRYEDGRKICQSCLATAVNKIDDCRKLAVEVQAELEAAGIVVDQKFELSLVSLEELNSKSGDVKTDHLGITLYEKSEILGGLFSTEKYEIRVLYGLPLAQLRAVLAHELMHVWQFDKAPRPQNQQMCEGTCQYASYLILQNDKSQEGRIFLENIVDQDDEIYGQGFKEVLGYVDSVGLNAWLDYLQHNKDAPW